MDFSTHYHQQGSSRSSLKHVHWILLFKSVQFLIALAMQFIFLRPKWKEKQVVWLVITRSFQQWNQRVWSFGCLFLPLKLYIGLQFILVHSPPYNLQLRFFSLTTAVISIIDRKQLFCYHKAMIVYTGSLQICQLIDYYSAAR